MAIEVNTEKSKDPENRIDVFLGASEKDVESFMEKYVKFMDSVIDEVLSGESINSLGTYKKVKEIFEGKELELFISQITSQCVISTIELAQEQAMQHSISDLAEAISNIEPSGAILSEGGDA